MSVTIHDNADQLRLQVEGALAGPIVRELEMCWLTASSTLNGRRLRVDLRHTQSIDKKGKGLLHRLHGNGADFVAAHADVSAVVQEITGRAPLPPEERKPSLKQQMLSLFVH